MNLLRTTTGDRADTQTANGESLAHELVPLGLATRTIYAKVYQGVGSPGRLIGLAHTVAALAPLYTHNSDGSDIRLLTDAELLSGFFRKDGAELHFTDGRPPIVNIAATHRTIELVAGILLASTVR